MLKKIGCLVIGIVLLLSLTACSLALPDDAAQKDYFCGIWIVPLEEDEFLNDNIDLTGFADPDAAAMWLAIHTISDWEPYMEFHSGQNFTGINQDINIGDDYKHTVESTVYLESDVARIAFLALYMRPDGSMYAVRDVNYYGFGFSSLSYQESHYGTAPSGSAQMITYGFTFNLVTVAPLDYVEIVTLSADYQPIEIRALTADEFAAQARDRTVAQTVPENCEYVLVTEIRSGGEGNPQHAFYSRHQEMSDSTVWHSLAIPDGSGIAKIYALNIIFA